MEKPFHGYTTRQAGAIRKTLIEQQMKPDADWPDLLDFITNVIFVAHHSMRNPLKVVYASDAARRLQKLTTALDGVLEAHEALGLVPQWRLDECLSPDYSFKKLTDAMTVVKQAIVWTATRPSPHISAQRPGAPKNVVMRRAVSTLLRIFEMATGIPPKVYASHHHDAGYAGNFYPFAVACLGPVRLVPAKTLGSNILAAYKEWRRAEGHLATQK